jgi:hypothetical protein
MIDAAKRGKEIKVKFKKPSDFVTFRQVVREARGSYPLVLKERSNGDEL